MATLLDRPEYSYRQDPEVPDFEDGRPIAVMDGKCVVCTSGARLIARFDRRQAFRICPTQSRLGTALERHYGMDPDDPETWLFLDGGRAWSGMEAVIRIGTSVGGVGRLLGIMRALPRPGREWLYRRMARNRHVLGGTEMCALPDPELRARLLD